MSKNVIIIGAGGHAKVIADIILCSGDNIVGFLDDGPKQKDYSYNGRKIIGSISDTKEFLKNYFVIAIGDNHVRAKIVDDLKDVKWYTAIHPSAVIADTVKIGEGTVVMAGSVINPDSVIGRHSIINTACSIDHDNNIGDFVHISPGTHLAGTVSVGDYSWICTGVNIINNINICSDVIIGAGALVLQDIKKMGTYIGAPARLNK